MLLKREATKDLFCLRRDSKQIKVSNGLPEESHPRTDPFWALQFGGLDPFEDPIIGLH